MGEKRLAVGNNKGAPRNSVYLKGFCWLLAENADAHNAKFLQKGSHRVVGTGADVVYF